MGIETILLTAVGLIPGIASHSAQQKAEQTATAEKIAGYEYNIERVREETTGKIGDIKRGGAAYTRAQKAAIGASGAEIGTGTPLMAQIETAASIERDITRTKRGAQLETEYYQEQIDILKPKPKKKIPWGPQGHGHGGGPGAK